MGAPEPVPLEPVRILCAADKAYAGPLCAMLVSVLAHHPKNRAIIIYILASTIPEEERRGIEASLVANHPGFTTSSLHWLAANRDAFQGLPVSDHVSLETYSRLLAPFVLPEDCERVLYLDSDLIVLSDVSAIYDAGADGRALHAARDLSVGIVSARTGVFNYSELGIAPETPYCNGGVLVMNLRRWRDEKIADRILDYLQTHKDKVNYWDQGGINAILHDAWTEIDPTWNQTRAIIYPELWKRAGYSMAEWRRVRNHPRIIHYTGASKPWTRSMDFLPRPGYSYFFKYLDRTPYRNVLHGPRLERIIGYRAYFLLWQTMRTLYHLVKKTSPQ